MKWEERAALVTKQRYVALVTDDGKRELGRYWIRGDGFEPESTRNNARVRETEDEARHVVLNQVLDRMKSEIAEIGRLHNALMMPEPPAAQRRTTVPRGTNFSEALR
jgi:hypothetical protein